jgi:hypothetical protein
LATLALVLDWLAQVWEWSLVGVVENRTHGVITYSTPIGSSLPTYLSYLALAIFISAGVLSVLQSRRRRFAILIPFSLYLILACGTFWLLVGYDPSEYRFALGPGGPLTFVMCVGVYAGFDRTLWPALRPVALVIAYAATALGLYYALRLSGIGVFEGPTPMNQHLPTGFWFALYALLSGGSSGWKSHVVALIPIALCIPIAILIASRSLAILPTLALALGLMSVFKSSIRVMPVKTLALGLLAVILLGAGMWGFTIAMPDQLERFEGRLTEDTRTPQYSQFFEQVPVVSLITGLGPNATYTYRNQSGYSYIDNQFLFILFRYGLPMLLGYCAIVLWPGLRLLVCGGGEKERLLGFFFAFWTLAMLGVSIFHAIVNNPPNLLTILLAGRCFTLIPLRGKPTSTRQRSVRFVSGKAISSNDARGLGWVARTSRSRQ